MGMEFTFGYGRRVTFSNQTDPSQGRMRRIAAQIGVVVSAFVVFLCGWLAMRADAWPKVILYSLLALVAAGLASYFRRATR
jgi:hypothetical protein